MTDPILNNAERVIAAFGGIRPTAKALGVAVTTVQGWKERGTIPVGRLDAIRQAAKREGIDFGGADPPRADDRATSERPPAKPERVRATRVEPPPESGVREAESPSPPPVIDQRQPDRSAWIRPFAFGAGIAIVLAAGIFLGWYLGPERPGSDVTKSEVTDLGNRLQAAEARARSLAGDLQESRRSAAGLVQRIERQEARIKSLESNSTASPGAIEALRRDLEAAVKRLDTRARRPADNAEISKQIGPIASRLQALERRVGKIASAAADPAKRDQIAKDIEALTAQVKALKDDIGKVVPTVDGNAAANKQAIGELAKRVDSREQLARTLAAAVTSIEAQITKMAVSIGALESRIDAVRKARSRLATQVAAVGQLRAQASAGRPYAGEIETVRALAGDNREIAALLATLATHAEPGLPTAASLRQRFGPLATAIVRASEENRSGGWIDRAWGRIKSTVVIRPRGADVKGDDARAVVARAEAALERGDLAAAVSLVEALPEAARGPAAGWLADARVRLAADAALRRLGALATKLASSDPAPPGR